MFRFTGERYLPTEAGEIRLEHYHRYALTCALTKGKSVLDLACGDGYGSALLSTVAHSVVGMDVAPDAVEHARATYGHLMNLRFDCGNAAATGLTGASFDLVVSFETIEHLAEQAEMIAETRRLLKPDGVLIISSPNRPVYSEGRDYHNEFHLKELDFVEFDALLRGHFDHIDYYGQRLAMGTVVQPLSEALPTYGAFSDDGKDVHQCTFTMRDPMYFLAVCGLEGRSLPKLNASIFLPDSLDLIEHYTGFARWAKQQDQELAIRDKNVRHYQAEVAAVEGKMKCLQEELSRRKAELADLNTQRDQFRLEIVRAQAQLDLLKSLYVDGELGSI